MRGRLSEGRVLLAICMVGAALRLGFAVHADGMYHPDDIQQSLEPAHGIVHGSGLHTREWDVGGRSWSVPGVFVLVLAVLERLGVTNPLAYTMVCRVLVAAIVSLWPYLCFRIVRALHSTRAGLLTAWLVATWPVFVLLAPRAFAHSFSITFAFWALARMVEEPAPAAALPPSRSSRFSTGLLFGIAVLFRAQDGLVAVGAGVYLLLRRRAGELPGLVMGALAGLGLVALFDWLTWGVPFQSIIGYARLAIGSGQATRMDVKPWSFFFTCFAASTGAGLALCAFVPAARRRILQLALLVGGLVVGLHMLVPHKEFRYALIGVLLLLCCAGSGVAAVAEWLAARRYTRSSAVLPAVVAAVWLGAAAVSAARLSFADLGTYSGLAEEQANPWTFRRDLNRALARVGTQSDLCALTIFPSGPSVGMGRLVSTGAYTYLNRGVPLVVGTPDAELARAVSHAVLCPDAQGRAVDLPGFAPIGREGDCVIARREPAGSCPATVVERFKEEWAW